MAAEMNRLGLILTFILADRQKVAFGNGEGVFGFFEVELPGGYLINASRSAAEAGETEQLDVLSGVEPRWRLAVDAMTRACLLDPRVRMGGMKIELKKGRYDGWDDLIFMAALPPKPEKSMLGECFEGMGDALEVISIPHEATSGPKWTRGKWSEVRKFLDSDLRETLTKPGRAPRPLITYF